MTREELDMKFLIEDKLLKAIISYLAKQPYGDVHELIAELARLPRQETNTGQNPPAQTDEPKAG
jgi:hypothetical protein